MNPNVSAVNRSSVAAANFGSIGNVGGALGQSSVPPAPTLTSKWWENVASGNTLIPRADISDTGDKLGRGLFKVPKAPVFDGNDVSYPSWSQNFLLSARHNNLYEAFVSEAEIPICRHWFRLDPLGRDCLLYTSPSPRDGLLSRMPSSA